MTAPAPSPRSVRNPLHEPGWVAEPEPAEPLGLHRRLPGYAATPLRSLPSPAEQLGVANVLVKDESHRLGLPAFKMLGASWATYRTLADRLGREPAWSTLDDLAEQLAPLRPLTITTATDGNHGRAVARFARLVGFPARIRVPAGTAQARIDAIEGEGATVTVTDGNYDDAVREVAEDADDRTVIVSDTSWPGYDTIPRWVIDGYTTIFEEIDRQLQDQSLPPPDVVVVPIGVGALAAAVATHYRRGTGPRPNLVGVEPITAACVMASAEAGQLVTLPDAQDSIMAGLNCGTPSAVAWPRVSAAFEWFVTVDDEAARRAMRTLADAGVVAGESGAATLAGAEQLRADTRDTVLAPGTTLLLLSTEGATDPDGYRRAVGREPAAVEAGTVAGR
jgi:diaminopropionate ammonia-lyase